MSVRRLAPVQPASFAWSAESQREVERWLAKFPAHRKQSASIPLLWVVQNGHFLTAKAVLLSASLYLVSYGVCTFCHHHTH